VVEAEHRKRPGETGKNTRKCNIDTAPEIIYPDVVNAEQLSEMLGGVSTKTVYRLLKKGEIKSKYIGKRYVIPKLYVIEYITRQQQ
jgi:excisionase family DNA binding protein